MNLAVHLLSFLCLIVALHLFARMRWQKDQLAKILRSIHSPQKNHTLLCSPCKVLITLLKALDIPFTHSNPLWKFWHLYPPTLHRLSLQELFETLNTLECHSAHLQTPNAQKTKLSPPPLLPPHPKYSTPSSTNPLHRKTIITP